MNLTVDASVFVAAARADDGHYAASRQLLQQLQAQRCRLVCPTLVLPECASAIARQTGDTDLARELIELVQAFPGMRLAPLDPPMARRAADIARRQRVRGADAVYVAVAEVFDAILIAWDSEMLERCSGVVIVVTPQEWLHHHAATDIHSL
jgi:predicted nucleic acid-binding protein